MLILLSLIKQLEKDQADLTRERDYVQSDDYVESWARDEGKMLQPGEHLVVPVGSQSSAEATPEPVEQAVVQTYFYLAGMRYRHPVDRAFYFQAALVIATT